MYLNRTFFFWKILPTKWEVVWDYIVLLLEFVHITPNVLFIFKYHMEWAGNSLFKLDFFFFLRQLRPDYLLCQKLNYRKVEQAPDLVGRQNEEIHPPGNRYSGFQDPGAPLIRLVTAVCTLASEPDYTNPNGTHLEIPTP